MVGDGSLRLCGHRALGVQQAIVIRPQSQFDERPRIGNRLRLPAILALQATQGLLGRVVPHARGRALQVALADQRFLDFPGALRIDILLPALAGTVRLFPMLALAGGGMSALRLGRVRG